MCVATLSGIQPHARFEVIARAFPPAAGDGGNLNWEDSEVLEFWTKADRWQLALIHPGLGALQGLVCGLGIQYIRHTA